MGGGSQNKVTRATVFHDALTSTKGDLAKNAIPRDKMADTLPALPNPRRTNVVFVVHGIRDKGFWTQKLARRIKHFGDELHEEFESHTQGYGYFAMLPFLLRSVRQRKVEWLMDRYTEERARFPHPGTKFHYIGHSNGTYLIARALENYPAVRFDRIVFAGSVVRRNFNWSNYVNTADNNTEQGEENIRNVSRVLNFVATSDWVVALLPKALQPWRWFDLGSAGYDGFDDASSIERVAQFQIKGGHGAAMLEENWDSLAKFIVSGSLPDKVNSGLRAERQNTLLSYISSMSPIILPLFVFITLLFGIGLFVIIWVAPNAHTAVLRAIPFLIYLSAIYLFVTRF